MITGKEWEVVAESPTSTIIKGLNEWAYIILVTMADPETDCSVSDKEIRVAYSILKSAPGRTKDELKRLVYAEKYWEMARQ